MGWGPFPDKATGEAQFMSGAKTFKINTDTLDAYATGPFELLGRTHDLVVGMNVSDRRTDYLAMNADDLTVNYQNWNNDAPRPYRFEPGLEAKVHDKSRQPTQHCALNL